MSRHPAAAELPPVLSRERSDPELEALPDPRRPGRRLTLAALLLTALVALAMAFNLRHEARYALTSGPPAELGNLAHLKPGPELANTWVHGEGLLGSMGAIRYKRPVEDDTYRLARVAGNENIWVEVRVPEGMEGPRFVPPSSFVGRFVPVSEAGIRHGDMPEAVRHAYAQGLMPEDAWVLVDGESPQSTRWALGLLGLFVAFAVFNFWGLFRLLRPVRDA